MPNQSSLLGIAHFDVIVMTRIGVLALQGDFREHREVLERLEVSVTEVRLPRDLAGLDGLILPGGESTTIVRLLGTSGLLDPLRSLARDGFPIWGTCAGMILLAKRLDASGIPALEAMDIAVRRNAFGRQVDSFEADLSMPILGAPPFHAVFIRAPIVKSVGPKCEILCKHEDRIVMVRQGSMLGSSFHPELTDDGRIHQMFLRMVRPETRD